MAYIDTKLIGPADPAIVSIEKGGLQLIKHGIHINPTPENLKAVNADPKMREEMCFLRPNLLVSKKALLELVARAMGK